MMFSSLVAVRIISSLLSKRDPFSGVFNFGNNQKSEGARSVKINFGMTFGIGTSIMTTPQFFWPKVGYFLDRSRVTQTYQLACSSITDNVRIFHVLKLNQPLPLKTIWWLNTSLVHLHFKPDRRYFPSREAHTSWWFSSSLSGSTAQDFDILLNHRLNDKIRL